jgi:hypothetical protein
VTDNPYAPPAEGSVPASLGAAAATSVHWFSPAQVGGIAFFGGPLAGTLLLWLNARAARRPRHTEVFLSLFVVLAVMLLVMLLPSRLAIGIGIAGAASLNSLAKLQLASYLREQPPPLPRRGWVLLGAVVAGVLGMALLAILIDALQGRGLIHD